MMFSIRYIFFQNNFRPWIHPVSSFSKPTIRRGDLYVHVHVEDLSATRFQYLVERGRRSTRVNPRVVTCCNSSRLNIPPPRESKPDSDATLSV